MENDQLGGPTMVDSARRIRLSDIIDIFMKDIIDLKELAEEARRLGGRL